MQGYVHHHPTNQRSSRQLLLWLGCIALLGLGVFLFIAGRRRSDMVEALPYLLFLLCPALHLLLHRGHGHQHAEQPASPADGKGARS
jgi:hypothetical protein